MINLSGKDLSGLARGKKMFENVGDSKCISCDRSMKISEMKKNVHGAGYLCPECATDWNKDAKNSVSPSCKVCGHDHDGDVCDDCECRIFVNGHGGIADGPLEEISPMENSAPKIGAKFRDRNGLNGEVERILPGNKISVRWDDGKVTEELSKDWFTGRENSKSENTEEMDNAKYTCPGCDGLVKKVPDSPKEKPSYYCKSCDKKFPEMAVTPVNNGKPEYPHDIFQNSKSGLIKGNLKYGKFLKGE